MNDVGRVSRIPNYLTASSPLGLRRLMFMTNIKRGIEFHYHSISVVNGKWIAWYNDEVQLEDELAKVDKNQPEKK